MAPPLYAQYKDELIATANAMAAPGKGLLAADESTGTIGKRFAGISVENVEPNRRAYRELLFTTPKGWGEYISGVILFSETVDQAKEDGTSFIKLMQDEGVIPGIKLDKGLLPIPGCDDDEKVTQGLDGLGVRAAEFYAKGCRFAKWRATYVITDVKPSALAIHKQAERLAEYAAICQANGLCPIVEPEVLMDGSHTIERCAEVTEAVQTAVFASLAKHGVLLEGMILKPNMICPGKECATRATAEEVAAQTVKVLSRTTPAAVPGIMFLSGGLSELEATQFLNAINNDKGPKPWALSFSYGRALQASVLAAWKGDAANVGAAQQAFLKRAKANFLAAKGEYKGEE